MQKKSFRFDKKVCVGKNLNLGICSKFGGNLREFWEILGKYRILDGRPLGSIGLNWMVCWEGSGETSAL